MWGHLRDPKFRHAVAVLVGTMVGAGIYGIPFSFAKAGFWVGAAWLAGLTAVVWLTNLLLAQVTLSVQGSHQLTGYAHILLGPWGKRLMTLAQVVGIYGALLAYIIIFGDFAHNVFSRYIAIDPQLYSFLFAGGWSLLWLVRLRTVAAVETGLIAAYAAIIALIAAFALPDIQPANFAGSEPHFWFLPYGVVLFALGGMSAVPLQRQLLAGRERLMRPAIAVAMLVAAVLYLVFAAAVVGMSGEVTSPEALSGLYGIVPATVIILGSLLGMFTVSTSYVALGTALYETFRLDYKVRVLGAWLLTVLPPVVFFWSGLRNFIDVIGLVGVVAGGGQAVLVLATYLRARRVRLREPEFRTRVPVAAVVALMALMLAGVGYEVWLK